MACGITVAPSIDAAINTVAVPLKRGIRPEATCTGFGGSMNRPAMKPNVITSSNAMIIFSNRRWVGPFWKISSTVDTAPMTQPPTNSGRPNSSFSAIAPPITSARSVAMAITSACMKNMYRPASPKRSPRISGRLRPVTMPSLADWYWMSTLMQFASTSTHTSRYP